MKPWWYLKSLCPTSARCCVPCHPHHGKPASTEIHAPFLGEWKPQRRQQGAPIVKPKTPESSPHQTTQPCQTSTALLMGVCVCVCVSLCSSGNTHDPIEADCTPQTLGSRACIAALPPKHGGLGPTVLAARPRRPFPSSLSLLFSRAWP